MKKIKAFCKPVDTILDENGVIASHGNRRIDSYTIAALQGLLAQGQTTNSEDYLAKKAVSIAIRTIEHLDETLTNMVL